MAQQFEQPLEGKTLRAQRMTSDESRAVIDLWQQEQADLTGLTDRAAVPDVAEGLDITVEDVQRLLSEVRAKRLEEKRELASEQELSEIRLAEEERQLAEIRRQRAELRREQVANKRQPVHRIKTKRSRLSWQLPAALVASAIVVWLWFIVYTAWVVPLQGNCTLAMPNGASQPCGPDYYKAHPETK